MLLIRDQQLRAFGEAQERAFAKKVTAMLHELFPARAERWGTARIDRFMEAGQKRAAILNLLSQREVSLYLCLMFAIEVDFQTVSDPPWTAELVERQSHSTTANLEELRRRILQTTTGNGQAAENAE